MLRSLIFIYVNFISLISYASLSCEYAKENQCINGEVCVLHDLDNASCVKFEDILPIVKYSYPKERAILCDQDEFVKTFSI